MRVGYLGCFHKQTLGIGVLTSAKPWNLSCQSDWAIMYRHYVMVWPLRPSWYDCIGLVWKLHTCTISGRQNQNHTVFFSPIGVYQNYHSSDHCQWPSYSARNIYTHQNSDHCNLLWYIFFYAWSYMSLWFDQEKKKINKNIYIYKKKIYIYIYIYIYMYYL